MSGEIKLLAVGLPLLVYLVNLISIVSIIFVRRKDMSVTFAWILVFIFLPIIGFFLYFFLGSTYKLEKMTAKYNMKKIESKYREVLDHYMEEMRSDKLIFGQSQTEKYKETIVMNSNNSNCIFSQDNSLDLLVNGQEKFPKLMAEIKEAKETINVLYFIIKTKDQIGKDLVALLAEKAKEGVEVKLVYDIFGWLGTQRKDFSPIVEAGGQVQRFLPSLFKSLIQINYRLHRKMVIIDGKIAYTGGINFGDDYLSLYPKMSPWRDTSVRIEGTAVNELQLRFLQDWIFLEKQNKEIKNPIYKMDEKAFITKYFPETEKKGKTGIQIVSGGPDEKFSAHKDSYVRIISDAKKYLYMQTPYFIPDQTLMDTLRLTAKSGADVRVMLPGIPDKKFVYYVTLSYVQDLLEAGIRVFIHKGFLHAKTFVVDDHVSSIGTSNFDIRSFDLDYEVNTLIYDTDFAIECKETFIYDMEDSREIFLEEYKQRGVIHYVAESICRFVAPLS